MIQQAVTPTTCYKTKTATPLPYSSRLRQRSPANPADLEHPPARWNRNNVSTETVTSAPYFCCNPVKNRVAETPRHDAVVEGARGVVEQVDAGGDHATACAENENDRAALFVFAHELWSALNREPQRWENAVGAWGTAFVRNVVGGLDRVDPRVLAWSGAPRRLRLDLLEEVGKFTASPADGPNRGVSGRCSGSHGSASLANYRGHVTILRTGVAMVVCATVPTATSGGSVVIPLGAVLGRMAVRLAVPGCRGPTLASPEPVQSCPGPGVRRIHLGSRRARPQSGPGQSSGLAVVCAALAEWATTARFRPARRLLPARGVARYRRTTSRFGPHPPHLHRRPEML